MVKISRSKLLKIISKRNKNQSNVSIQIIPNIFGTISKEIYK